MTAARQLATHNLYGPLRGLIRLLSIADPVVALSLCSAARGVHSPVRYAYWQEPATVWLVTLLLVSQNKGAKPSMNLLQDS